jgi:Abortive infection alpha
MEDFADMTDVPRKSDSSRGQLDTVAAALWAVTRDIRAASRAIPGVSLIEAQATAGERFFLRQIKAVLDQIDPPPTARAASPAEPAGPAASATAAALDGRPPTIDDRMRALLTRSLHTTPAESRRALHELLVSELVPDEARILSALSDGSTYPLVHIAEPGVGNTQQRVLENASSVGRAAGVALPDRVHVYVSHLLRLGLVESGPEDHSLRDEYDILLTEPRIRATIESTRKGPRGARIVRRTVRMSDLGRELWEAAQTPPGVDAHQPDPPDS